LRELSSLWIEGSLHLYLRTSDSDVLIHGRVVINYRLGVLMTFLEVLLRWLLLLLGLGEESSWGTSC